MRYAAVQHRSVRWAAATPLPPAWQRPHRRSDGPSVTTVSVTEPPRPLLRGWLHLVCFFLAIPAAVLVVAVADGVEARVASIVYAVGLIALFGVSGWYHRGRWSDVWRRRMQRLDHSTIFVMIAGSYTPLCLVVLDGWLSICLLYTSPSPRDGLLSRMPSSA